MTIEHIDNILLETCVLLSCFYLYNSRENVRNSKTEMVTVDITVILRLETFHIFTVVAREQLINLFQI